MKNKIKYVLTIIVMILVGCRHNENFQHSSNGGGSTNSTIASISKPSTSVNSDGNTIVSKTDDSSNSVNSSNVKSDMVSFETSVESNQTESDIESNFTCSNDFSSDSTIDIDPVELDNYQYFLLKDDTWGISVGDNKNREKLTIPERYQKNQ